MADKGDAKEGTCSPETNKLIKEGKNDTIISCQRCPCTVLNPVQARYVRKQFFLPHMKKKSEGQAPEDGEMLEDFWVVDNMYTFENVGFSNSVGTIKYLVCADCEVGPIGLHDLNDKAHFYVALDRVKHGR